MTMRRSPVRLLPALMAAVIAVLLMPVSASAQGSGRLVAIVNDQAISEYDLDQRVRMNKTLNGTQGSLKKLRQAALSELIDNTLKRQEAKRLKQAVTEKEIDSSYQRMSERAGVTKEAWELRLRSGGVEIKTIKQEISASLSWRRVVQARFGRRIQVENADVDREHQRALGTPRETQRFYVIRRIVLPLKRDASEIQVSITADKAKALLEGFRGCGRIKQAVAGLGRVKIDKPQTIPVAEAPADLRQALNKAGPGRAIGPGRTAEGVFVIAYCELKKVETQAVTREEVEQRLLYRKFDRIGSQFLGDLKRDAIIEYKAADLRS